MRALVVSETRLGNTHRIAEAIAGGFGEIGHAPVVGVADATEDPALRRRPPRRGRPHPGMEQVEALGPKWCPAQRRQAGGRPRPRAGCQFRPGRSGVAGATGPAGAGRRGPRNSARRPSPPHRPGVEGHRSPDGPPRHDPGRRSRELPGRPQEPPAGRRGRSRPGVGPGPGHGGAGLTPWPGRVVSRAAPGHAGAGRGSMAGRRSIPWPTCPAEGA